MYAKLGILFAMFLLFQNTKNECTPLVQAGNDIGNAFEVGKHLFI